VIFKPISQLGPGDSAIFKVRSRAEKSGDHRFRAEVVCKSVHTRLAAEEATHFYGDEKAVPSDGGGAAEEPPREGSKPLPQPAGEVVPQPQSPATSP
jgi:hypothetical protein